MDVHESKPEAEEDEPTNKGIEYRLCTFREIFYKASLEVVYISKKTSVDLDVLDRISCT